MWATMRSTFRLMLPIESLAFETVCSPERAPLAVSSAIWATRWALSAICFDVARSSLHRRRDLTHRGGLLLGACRLLIGRGLQLAG